MKNNQPCLFPRQSRVARLFLMGFALSIAPVGAQSTGGAATSPTGANTSFYNTPNSSSVNNGTHANGAYIPNNSGPTGSIPPTATTTKTPSTAPTGTVSPNVNAGGGSGSGQTSGTAAPSSP